MNPYILYLIAIKKAEKKILIFAYDIEQSLFNKKNYCKKDNL